MPVKKILVAFDGSKHSRKALEWALNSFEAGTASIEVVTVVEPIANYSIPEAFPLEVTAFHQDQQAMREEKLKELRQEWAACGKDPGFSPLTRTLCMRPMRWRPRCESRNFGRSAA